MPTNSIAAEIIADAHLLLSPITGNISLNVHRHAVSFFSTQRNIKTNVKNVHAFKLAFKQARESQTTSQYISTNLQIYWCTIN